MVTECAETDYSFFFGGRMLDGLVVLVILVRLYAIVRIHEHEVKIHVLCFLGFA